MTAAVIISLFKRIAGDVYDSRHPVEWNYGTVTKTEPIEITVNEKMVLEEDMIILTERVRDHNIEVTVDHWTNTDSGDQTVHTHAGCYKGSTGSSSAGDHRHRIQGKKTVTIHGALEVGDTVLLSRMQGGSAWVVVDAIERKRKRVFA